MILLAVLLILQNGVDSDEFVSLPKQAEFVLVEPRPKIAEISSIALNFTQLPRAISQTLKWSLQRWMMGQLYPAQNSWRKRQISRFQTDFLDEERAKAALQLQAQGFVVRHLTLEKNNVNYSALLIGHSSQIDNGRWILQATGNESPIEKWAVTFATQYRKAGYNLLLVNGPGVGRSEGPATPKSIGDAQEIGLQFLETKIDAKKMIIAGYSLGGAAIGMAILNHAFQTAERDYLVIRQMTFDRTSSIFKHYAHVIFPAVKPIIKSLVHWAGCEMDSVAASKKLEELEIPEVIIQAGDEEAFAHDGMIPTKSTLAYRLFKENIKGKTKYFRRLPGASHAIPLEATLEAIRNWDES